MHDQLKIFEMNTSGYLHRAALLASDYSISLYKNYKGSFESQTYTFKDKTTTYKYVMNGIPPKYMINRFQNSSEKAIRSTKDDLSVHFVYFGESSYAFELSCTVKNTVFIDSTQAHSFRLLAREELKQLKKSFGGIRRENTRKKIKGKAKITLDIEDLLHNLTDDLPF